VKLLSNEFGGLEAWCTNNLIGSNLPTTVNLKENGAISVCYRLRKESLIEMSGFFILVFCKLETKSSDLHRTLAGDTFNL